MFVVSVCPVFIRSPIIPAICPSLLVIWPCKLFPVEIKLLVLVTVNPETILISLVNV